jgi:predicted small metal-binding protein
MPRWTCALGHRIEADTENELITKIQDHMRREHGMEMSRERIERDIRDE